MGRSDICRSSFGTTFHARRWLSLDPWGLCCMTLSFSIHTFAFYTIYTHLISYSILGLGVFYVLYAPSSVLALSSLFMAWTTNPGAVPMGARPLGIVSEDDIKRVLSSSSLAKLSQDRKERFAEKLRKRQRNDTTRKCRKCNDNYKPPRAHHDSVTGRCIVKMDHYCPWICNTVGVFNHKFFLLFIFYTFITSVLSLFLVLGRFLRCSFTVSEEVSMSSLAENDSESLGENNIPDCDKNNDAVASSKGGGEEEDLFDPSIQYFDESHTYLYPGCENLFTFQITVLFVATIVFMFFTCCMLIDQTEAVKSNTNKIARMKLQQVEEGVEDHSEFQRVTTEFNEIFGGDSPNIAWHWFLPLPIQFPDGMQKVVLGYEWDERYAIAINNKVTSTEVVGGDGEAVVVPPLGGGVGVASDCNGALNLLSISSTPTSNNAGGGLELSSRLGATP